jgi:antibiotic biosynthesis monooxygenase (ABM) superfamily enzyme
MVMERPTRHEAQPEPPIRWKAANLLLLLPLSTLVTPLYNRIEPRLFGLAFFYWFLLAVLLLTIAFTALFFALTRDDRDAADRAWR